MMHPDRRQKKGGNAPTVLPKGSRQDRTSALFIGANILNVNECKIGVNFNAKYDDIFGATFGDKNWRVEMDQSTWKVGGEKRSYHDWLQARVAAEEGGA